MNQDERDELFNRLLELSNTQIINTFASLYGHLSFLCYGPEKEHAIKILRHIEKRVSEHE